MKKIEKAYYLLEPYLNNMSTYVIDIGALNIEWANSKPFIDRGYNVLLIEPNPDSYNILYDQIKNKENVILSSKAINNYSGNTKFLISKNISGYSRIPNSLWNGKFVDDYKEIMVECWTIEKMFENYPDFKWVDFIDIDVEGMDEIILEELFKTNSRPKFIMIEHQNLKSRIDKQKDLFIKEKYKEIYKIEDSSLWQKIF